MLDASVTIECLIISRIAQSSGYSLDPVTIPAPTHRKESFPA
jgi:hypothetical protein